ncbi:hypothetical protein G5B39_05000 [Rhodobacteraceae bacterium SC52]|nr:hypothetical protein G5B39_05000 [Rhodobacteraceae bacterium SC52]
MKVRKNAVARALSGVLVFQLVIGGLLILGDSQSGANLGLPSLSPSQPRLTEPVQPGDQRRVFRPGRDAPATQPARAPGKLPKRLALAQENGAVYRLEGAIAPGDGERIIGLLTAAEPAPETLIVQSSGGSVLDALALGRHIRKAEIGTQVLRGEFCYSACPYLFAGGVERTIEEDAYIGVHQHFFGQSTVLPAAFAVEDIQRGQGDVMVYLIEMGIDPAVMQFALTTPPDEIYILLPEQLETFGFPTEKDAS